MNIEKVFIHKLTVFFAAATFAVLGVACSTTQTAVTDKSTDETKIASVQTDSVDSTKSYRAEFKTEPGVIEAGKKTMLIFNVKDASGAVIKDLEIVHEKPMHLLIASKDLAEFYHIHPDPQPDGSYRVAHTFPNGGEYRLYADYKPKDAKGIVEQIDIKVEGTPRANVPLQPDTKLEKAVDGLRVTMKPDAEIKAGQELMLNFQAFDAKTGRPATDLENYLGELAHFVIISEDMKDFVHAHPMSRSEHNSIKPESHDHNADGHTHSMKDGETKTAGVWEVAAHTAFPRAGLYKIWAQFQRGGQIITVPFVVNVKEGDQKASLEPENIPAGAIKVTVSGEGYNPASIPVRKGEAVKLAFYRADAENCGGELAFPKLNINKKLPVGKTVLVEFTPREAGEISFTCGMGMYKGKIVAQ